MERSSEETPASGSRRTMIAGVGAVGALAALAACGTAANNASGDGGSMPDSGGSSPTGNPTSAAPASSSTGSATGGTALGKTAEVPVGGGKIYDAAKVVVTQPTAGTFKAFTSICTHQGCAVNKVASGVISCPCHGSTFSAKDGSVKGGPAPAPLAAKTVKVQGDSIYLA
jgi:Rieske Fe-S protein